MKLDRVALIVAAGGRLGIPYGFGYKWDLKNKAPVSPIDCSGFVRWCYYQGGAELPDGSWAQHQLCEPCNSPLPGDLGFFFDENGRVDHVGIIFDNLNMIEARGNPFDQVILRPRAKWEAWPRFSGYMRVKGLES